MTVLEQWYADDYLLTEGSVRQWEYRSGTNRTGGLAGQNADVPMRRGQLWVRKKLGAGQFVFNMWLAGVDANDVFASYELLLQQVVRDDRLVTWKRVRGSDVRVAQGEVISAVEPQFIGQQTYRLALEVLIPDGVWRSSTAIQVSSGANPTLPKDLYLAGPAAASTAPIDEATIVVTGPIDSGFVIADINGGDKVTVNQAIPAGCQLILNSATWDIQGSGSGFTPNIAAVNPSGPRLLTIRPGNQNTQPGIELRGSGGGASTALQVTAAGQYLV